MLTAFTPGDLVVYRVGTGSGSLGGSAAAVFLDEYTPSGTLVQSIAMPTSGSTELTAGGTATSEGQMTLSPDGSTIALTGYTVAPGASTQGSDNGTVALLGAAGSATYYVLPSASVVNSNNIRTATVDGNKLYISGAASDIQYASVSSLTAGGTVNAATTTLNSTVANVEDLQIFNGQLYFSTEKQSSYASLNSDSIGTMGSGEPTAGSSSYAGVTDTSTKSYSFFFERLAGGSGAPDTLYVADSNGGIEKFSLVGSAWTAEGTKSVNGGAYGITGVLSGTTVTIYATNAAGIYKLTDTSGASATINGTVSTVVSAGTNTSFDGVTLAPDDGVGAITGLGGTTNYTQGSAAVNPASAATFADASNFDGGTLVISGGLANDTLGITAGSNSITTSGGTVSYGGAQIGTFSGGSGTTALTITFNSVGGAAVSGAAVQALIKQIAFSSTSSSATGNRTLSFQVTENSGATDTAATQTVSVSAAVGAPSINALGTLNINQGAGQQTINLGGIQHNGGSGTITVTAASNNTALTGALTVNYTSPNSTGTVTFTPAAGVSGSATITVTVTDNGGSATATESVVVIPPPVNTVPGAQTVVENSAISFSTANGDAISIADTAVGSSNVQVALSVSHGALTLSGVSGLTFASGANGQASFTVTGTITNINAALSGLTYTPTSGYTGADTLQLVTNDLGNTASGSAQSSTSTVALTISALPSVRLNEIEANPPGGDDNRYEYVELSGAPNQSLSNVYFVTFDGSSGSTGVADLVVNLSGYSLGSDGLLVIQSSATTGHSIPPATTLVSDSTFFTQSGGFKNGSLSFFLYDSPNAAFTAGTDYDTNDDGALDHLPSGAVSLDNVAILDTNNVGSDLVYGGVDVTEETNQNLGTADAVTRFPGNNSTTNAAWFGGELVDTGNVDSTIDYDPTRQSANEPANAYLTPGAPNYPQAPVFNSTSYSFNVQQTASAGSAVGTVSATPGGSDTLSYSLSGVGSSSFTINSSTGAVTVASGATLSGSSYSLTATATDGQDGETANAPVTINVLSAPVFSPTSYTFSVQATASAGSTVGTISATAEGADTESYSLSGSGSGNFAVSGGGVITVASGASLSGTSYSLTATATDNQNSDSSTAPVTINVLSTPSVTVSDTGGVYTGGSYPATAQVNNAASLEGVAPTLAYYVGGTATGASTATAPTTVGTYTVVAKFAGSPHYNAASSSPVTFSITQATPTVTVSDAGGVYTGGSFPATALVNGAASLESVAPTLTYYVGSGTSGASSSTAPSAAGSYTVVASFAGSADYAAASSSALTFTISKAASSISVTSGNKTYNASAYSPTVFESGSGGAISYTYYVGSNTAGTNLGSAAPSTAGTYTVVASVAADANYAAASSSPVTFNITQATPTVTVSDAGGTYTGSSFPATAVVNGGASLESVAPTLTYYVGSGTSGASSSTAPTAVGTYTVVASFAGSTDYAAATSSPTTFTIAKATPTVLVSDAGGVYTGSSYPATATVNGLASLEGIAPTLLYTNTVTGITSTTAPSAAGSYSVTASFAGSSDYNSAASSPLAFSIRTGSAPTVTVSDAGGTYNGSAFPATALVNGQTSLEGVTPTLTYYVGSGTSGASSAAAPVAAGTYTVVASFAGSADYAAASSSPITFTIAQATPTVTVSDAGGAYTGSGFPATALVNGGASLESVALTLTYYVGSGTSGTSSAAAPVTAGAYTVVASFAGSADYSAASSSPVTFNITQATPTVTVSDAGGVYTGGSFPAAALVNGAASLEGVTPTLTYYVGSGTTGASSAAAPIIAGAYTVVASFAGTADYSAASSSPVTFNITQATPTVTVSDAGGAYTGSSFPAAALVNGAASLESVTPTLTYYVGSGTSGTSNSTAPITAGAYTVVASFAGSTDYAAATSSPATFVIAPAASTVGVTAAGGVFTGQPFAATANVNGQSSLEGVSPTLLYYAGATPTGAALAGDPITVGVYTVVATFAGSADYAGASAQQTFSITPATPNVTVSDAGGVYTGSSFPAAALVNGIASLEGVTPTLVYYVGASTVGASSSMAPIAAGTYTVVANFAGSLDYSAASDAATFAINPATPSVTVSDSGGPFRGNAYPATALVNGVASLEGVTPTLAYYSGSTASGASTATAPSAAGTYTVVAAFAGSADYAAATSSPITFTITAPNPPSIGALGALAINENSGSQTVQLSGISANGSGESLTVSASSNNPALVPNTGAGALSVNYVSPANTGSFSFTPAAGTSGTASVTVTVSDTAGSATATEMVTVIAPPVNTVPGAQNVIENVAHTFSSANGDALSISDSAVGANTMQVALSVSHGTLALGSLMGITFANGANHQASMTLVGTIANLNAALSGLTFTPTSGFSGSDALQLVANDLGNTASGVAQSSTSSVALTVLAPPTVLLNEIDANPPGTQDNRYEYIELSGAPGTSLSNVDLVVFNGIVADNPGVADLVVNLSNYTIGSDGLLAIKSSISTGFSIPAGTTVVSDPSYFTQTGGLPDGTLSFYLCYTTGSFTAGSDYDPNNSGVLQNLPSDVKVLDDVALLDNNSSAKGDITYGSAVVYEANATGTPDAVTRFDSNSTPSSSAAWYGGDLIDTGNVDSQTYYDITRASSNEPSNAYITPGAINYPHVTPTLAADNALSVSFGATGTISSALLQVTDADDTPSQLAYTITVAPTNGTLERNGVALAAGNIFTQADINANEITYVNSHEATDSFVFTVSDGAGGSLGATTFNINVLPPPPPVITTSAGATTASAGFAAVVDSGIALTDTNPSPGLSGVVSISSGFESGDMLALTTQNGISGSYNASTGVLTISASGSPTLAQFQAALASITFTSSSGGLGSRTISFSVTDDAQVSNTAMKQITVAAAPPEVVGVYVDSTSWSYFFNAYLGSHGLGSATLGYALQTGASQLTPLPWININQISVVFSEPVTISSALQSNLSLIDLTTNLSSSSFSASMVGSEYVATWTFASPLGNNKYLVYLPSSGVVDANGNSLDGNYNTSTSQFAGDGQAGNDFVFQFNVLPGDANQANQVGASAVNAVRFNEATHSQPAYDPYYDVEGAGNVGASDVNDVRLIYIGSHLSLSNPTPPANASIVVAGSQIAGLSNIATSIVIATAADGSESMYLSASGNSSFVNAAGGSAAGVPAATGLSAGTGLASIPPATATVSSRSSTSQLSASAIAVGGVATTIGSPSGGAVSGSSSTNPAPMRSTNSIAALESASLKKLAALASTSPAEPHEYAETNAKSNGLRRAAIDHAILEYGE